MHTHTTWLVLAIRQNLYRMTNSKHSMNEPSPACIDTDTPHKHRWMYQFHASYINTRYALFIDGLCQFNRWETTANRAGSAARAFPPTLPSGGWRCPARATTARKIPTCWWAAAPSPTRSMSSDRGKHNTLTLYQWCLVWSTVDWSSNRGRWR